MKREDAGGKVVFLGRKNGLRRGKNFISRAEIHISRLEIHISALGICISNREIKFKIKRRTLSVRGGALLVRRCFRLFLKWKQADYEHAFRRGIDAETVVRPFAYQPNDILAATQHPLPLFMR